MPQKSLKKTTEATGRATCYFGYSRNCMNSRSSSRPDYRDASERATAAFLWFLIAPPTLLNVSMVYRVSESPWDPPPLSLELVGLVALMSALFGYMISSRLKEGPKTKGRMPYLKYLGTFLVAMALAWLLFLLNLPTKKTVRTWTGRGSSEG